VLYFNIGVRLMAELPYLSTQW